MLALSPSHWSTVTTVGTELWFNDRFIDPRRGLCVIRWLRVDLRLLSDLWDTGVANVNRKKAPSEDIPFSDSCAREAGGGRPSVVTKVLWKVQG